MNRAGHSVRVLRSVAAAAAVLAAMVSQPIVSGRAASNGVIVSNEAHHDTSPPLRSMPDSGTRGVAHPARRDPTTPPSGTPGARSSDSSHAGTSRAAPVTANNVPGIPADGVAPPDNDGAAGTTQYIELVNSEFEVFSKTGSVLLSTRATNTLWSGFGGGCQTNNDGDGTVLWDSMAQRWFIQQFSVSTTPYLDCLAVSTSSDATGTWNRYSFQYSSFPDYPKTGVWPDAYYASFNLFNATGTLGLGAELCAFNRSAMLAGTAATQQCFMATASGEHTFLPATLDGTTQPPSGEPEWFVGLSPNGGSALGYYKFHVDWTTPANSSLSSEADLAVAAFSEACGGGTCIPQSGTTQQLDSLADRVMYRLAYRNFGDHEAMVVNHSVTAGTSVGVRWYELRPSNGALTVFQQGTVAPDSSYRWMGSVAMNKAGDIAAGYSVSSSSLHPAIVYTGRFAGDAAGTMPQGETTLIAGAGSQTGQSLSRWGDYTEMTVDPADDCTFWYVNQYEPASGAFNWATRIGSFQLSTCGATAGNDFSISASPSSATVTQGGSATSTITTAVTSGSAQSIALSASGLPTGSTASFNPTSVTAGGSSTLTVTTSASTPAGTYTITVTGTGTSATHTTSVTLTVNSAAGGGIVNGGFETGNLSGWTAAGTTSVTSADKQAGTYSARLGSTSPTNGDSSIAQTFTVPSGGTGLQFYYNNVCPDTLTYDWATATLKDNTAGTTTTPLAKTCTSAGWHAVSAAVTAGHSYTLTLISHDDNYSADPTYTDYDSVAITSSATTNDFSIAASAMSPSSVAQGGSATSTITTAVTSGSAQTVTLSASGVPAGATASFNPTSVTAGSSSTLTVATTASTPAGTYTITVTGTGTSATHSSTTSLTVTTAATGGIVNGGFETGNLSGWTVAGTTSVTGADKQAGTYSARVGSTSPTNGDSSIAQTFTVPSGGTGLQFYYNNVCPDTLTYDWATATLRDNTAGTTTTPLARTCTNSGWHAVSVAVTAGHSYTLTLISHDDNYSADPTYTDFDSVAITLTAQASKMRTW